MTPDKVTMIKNLILIGMPGCGKSTLGVLLAKRLAMQFVDTDLIIQKQSGVRLHDYQSEYGMEAFRSLENKVLCSVDCDHTVVATGGSAVYYPEAMAHLKTLGRVVYLDVPLEVIRARVGDLEDRGVVIEAGTTLADLMAERKPLYQHYADSVVVCGGKPLHDLLDEVSWLAED